MGTSLVDTGRTVSVSAFAAVFASHSFSYVRSHLLICSVGVNSILLRMCRSVGGACGGRASGATKAR